MGKIIVSAALTGNITLPTQTPYLPLMPEQIADGVGQMRSLGKGADKDKIDVGRQLIEKVLKPRVTNKLYVVTGLLAPHRNDLGHDACKVGMHDPCVEGSSRPLCHKVKDSDSEFGHR